MRPKTHQVCAVQVGTGRQYRELKAHWRLLRLSLMRRKRLSWDEYCCEQGRATNAIGRTSHVTDSIRAVWRHQMRHRSTTGHARYANDVADENVTCDKNGVYVNWRDRILLRIIALHVLRRLQKTKYSLSNLICWFLSYTPVGEHVIIKT